MPATLSILTNVFHRRAGAGPGDRALGRGVGSRRRDRPARRRLPARALLVGFDLPGERADRRSWRSSPWWSSCPTRATSTRPGSTCVGTVLSAVGLIALLFGIIEGPARGWGDPLIVGCVRRRRRAAGRRSCCGSATPTTRSSTSASSPTPASRAASIAITFVFFAMFGSLFFVSQYLQFVLGYSALQSGARAPADRRRAHGRGARSAPSSSGCFGTKRSRRRRPRARRGRAARVLAGVDDTSGYGLVGARARRRRPRHGLCDGAGDRLDHGIAARRRRPASARR